MTAGETEGEEKRNKDTLRGKKRGDGVTVGGGRLLYLGGRDQGCQISGVVGSMGLKDAVIW